MVIQTSNEQVKTLSAFAQKAIQRLQDKKSVKHRKLFVPSLDCEVTIRNLSYKEIVEITEIDEQGDPNRADKYTIYQAVAEPSLKEIAQELKQAGEITEYLEVVDMLDLSEIQSIAMQVMDLSGVIGGKVVTVVEELKN